MTAPPIHGSILGTRVTRTEDPALLFGAGKYVADLPLTGRLHAVFATSDVAFGVLNEVHVDEARAMPGVVAVWTAKELEIPAHHGFVKVHDDFVRSPLAEGRVRFVGDPIAVVFAETFAQAEDAAETIWADIDVLPALVDAEMALADDATPIFEQHGSNQAIAMLDKNLVDVDALSDHVVRGRYVNQRVAVVPMEPDCCAAAPEADGRITVYPSTQMPHLLHGQLAGALGWDVADIHIVTPQVGGGFGGKAGLHPEYAVVTKAARVLDRPVVWVPTRTRDMTALPHSRGQVQYAELGVRRDGTFTGLRVRLVGDAGAYPSIGAFLPAGTRRMSQGTYTIPASEFSLVVAVTNTTPMGAYRGAGRPEATAMLERLVDQAAIELQIDPIELRLRNLVSSDAFPYQTLLGHVYDSGDYALPLRTAAEAVGYDELRAEQSARRARGDRNQLGIGVSSYVEITAGGDGGEFAALSVHDDGSATVFVGTASHGQGHQTAYAMLVSSQTGIPIDRISLVDGDTDRVPTGGGTGGSRSLQLGGSAVRGATEIVVDRAKQLAAQLLEADPADVVVDVMTGMIGVAGVPASGLTWAVLASRAASELGEALEGEFNFRQDNATFPFGAHIAVVEVDIETGKTRMLRHVAVDDCGTVLNPLLVEGQQHGGIASGIGQALFEEVRYDDDGNPVSSNLAEYAIVSAAELPSFEVHSTQTPTPLNPLGAKGIGEAATIGSTPAVQNAVIDAVSHLGIRHIDMPCTPLRVWTAIVAAQAGNPTDPWREPPSVFTAPAAAGGESDEGLSAAEGI